MPTDDRHPQPITPEGTALSESWTRSALLEREPELAALRTLIAETAGGRSRVVVVDGAGGIGKTRLLDEARRLAAESNLRVLTARGGELERDFAFGVVRQLFEQGPGVRDGSALTGPAAAARGVFELAGDDAARSDDPSFASLHGLYWLTVNVTADAPLVIAIDDLHWCDDPSLRFLAYLVRRLEGLPVLLICTLRPSERSDFALLDEITRDPLSVSIQPGVLSVTATLGLVRGRLGENAAEAFSAACHTATGGNPLLLHELLKTLADEGVQPDATAITTVADLGPRVTSRAVLLRLARLPEAAVKVARAAAVLRDDFDVADVASLATVDIEDAGPAMAALVRAEILRERAPLGFVHPLVGAAVLNDMSTAERALAHERAARLLLDAGSSLERVAAHLLASPPRGQAWVVDTLLRAGRSSLHKGAAESAVAYLARALREPPPPEERGLLLLELGRAEALTSGTAAVEHLRQAYELLDDEATRAAAAQLLARTLLLTGRLTESAALASRAAAALPAELEDVRRGLEAIELVALVLAGGDGEALGRLAFYRRRPVPVGLGAKMLAAVAAQEWMLAGGPSDACAELAIEALAGGDLVEADNGLLAVTAIVVLALADRDEAIAAWQSSLADAHGRGSLFSRKSVTFWRGFTLLLRGDLADAEESVRSSVEDKLWGMGQQGHLYYDAILSAVLRERGDLRGARSALEESTDPGDHGDAARYWLQSKLELLLLEGRLEEALAVARHLEARFTHVANPVDTPWRCPAAVALHRLGRSDDALAVAVEGLELARRWGAPGTLSRALRTLGTLGRDSGIDQLREAVDVVAGSPARLEHARSLAALGAALRRAGRPSDARGPLREALELADVLGAQSLAEDVRSELYASGARPRRSALRGVASLTVSERRVATLATRGRTNREIAQELFVTPKTVELHLGNVYRKLAIRSRHELPDELRGPQTPA
jgi:DNA-binding NarL/FixJ family response regulator